jgi:O-antigen/teichoic acid export membrane protein
MSVARRVAWNTSYQALARGIGLCLALVSLVFLTRYLGVAGYGRFTTVTVYISVFVVLFDWGIGTIVVRRLAIDSTSAAELIGKTLTLRILLGIATAGVAGALAAGIYADKPEIRNGIFVALPIIVVLAVVSALATFFQAELRMGWMAVAETAGQVVAVALILGLIAADAGFYAIVAATVAAAVVNAVLVLVFFSRRVPIRPRIDVALWRRLFVEALPLGIALILNTIYFRLDAVLLSVLKGPHDVGIYGIAFRFSEMLTPFALYFATSMFPLLSRSSSEGRTEEIRALIQRSFDVVVVVALPIVLGTIVVAPQIVDALAGAEFAPAATPLRIVVVGTGLAFVSTLLGYVTIALGRQKQILWLNVVALGFNLVLNLALIPPYGYLAAAWVATASEALIAAGLVWMTWRLTGFRPASSVPLRALIASGAMAAAVAAFHPNLAVAVVVGVVVYGAALVLLRVHDQLQLSQLFARRAS